MPISGPTTPPRSTRATCSRRKDGTLILLRQSRLPVGAPARHDAAAARLGLCRRPAGPHADYYLRAQPTFETPVGKHDWLTRHVFVGVGERRPDGNHVNYYALT
jgi:hypothetical protein